MRLRRKPAAEDQTTPKSPDDRVLTTDLVAELADRGFETAVAGSWADLERRACAAELAAAGYALQLRELRASSLDARLQRGELVDGSEAIEELTDLAAVELPRVAGELKQAWDENRELHERSERSERSEREASAVAQALIGEEFPEHID